MKSEHRCALTEIRQDRSDDAPWSMTMDTILLTGKTGIFTKEALQYIGETMQVFVTGSRPGTEMKKLPETVRLLPPAPADDDFRTLFELGEIRAVWHVT